MKIVHLIAALLLASGLSAQNWATLPGTKPFHIARFYNDTATGSLIAYGAFDTAGTVAVPGIAAWDGTLWGPVDAGMPNLPFGPSITSALRYQGNLLFGGYIPSWNSYKTYIAKWNGVALDSFAVIKNGEPGGMLAYQNDLIVYGDFDTIQNIHASSIARWNGANWSDLGFNAFDVVVNKMIEYHGGLYAAGYSATDLHDHVFKLVNNTWQPVGQTFDGPNARVLDLCIYNDKLYAGGYFSTTSSPASVGNAIAVLDTASNTWSNVGGGLISVSIASFSQVTRMTVHNGALYVMGWFDHAGGAYAPYIAKWDGTQWCGFGVGFSYTLTAIVDYNGELYLGTGPVFDNDTSYGFVKWIGGNYTDTCGVVTTGIEAITRTNALRVFPDPVSDILTFELEGTTDTGEIIITDQTGREVRSEKTNGAQRIEISVADLAEGLYFYQLFEKGEWRASGKFIRVDKGF